MLYTLPNMELCSQLFSRWWIALIQLGHSHDCLAEALNRHQSCKCTLDMILGRLSGQCSAATILSLPLPSPLLPICSVHLLRESLSDPVVLCGGGCTETVLANHIRQHAVGYCECCQYRLVVVARAVLYIDAAHITCECGRTMELNSASSLSSCKLHYETCPLEPLTFTFTCPLTAVTTPVIIAVFSVRYWSCEMLFHMPCRQLMLTRRRWTF